MARLILFISRAVLQCLLYCTVQGISRRNAGTVPTAESAALFYKCGICNIIRAQSVFTVIGFEGQLVGAKGCLLYTSDAADEL